MKLVIVRKPGGCDALELTETAMPMPGNGDETVRARAIDVDKSGVLIRKGVYR